MSAKKEIKKVIDQLQKMQDDVTGFIILVATDKKTEEDKQYGLNACAGKMGILANLYMNIDPQIRRLADSQSMLQLLGNLVSGKIEEIEKSNKGKENDANGTNKDS